ncbi:hypothetical protein D3C77_287160 [compost metagenome]
MPRLRGESHQCNDDSHPEARAQKHDFAAVSVGKLAPNRLKNESRGKIRGEYRPGPQTDCLLALHMQISCQIKRQKRSDHGHAGINEELTEPKHKDVHFPSIVLHFFTSFLYDLACV